MLAGAAAWADSPTRQRPEDRLLVFTSSSSGAVEAPAGAPTTAVPVGSLSKPFVARAWARAHPGEPPPPLRCLPSSHCWVASGHGSVGLARALAVSCNTYFRALAQDIPPDVLAASLREAGLRAPDPITPDQAIGLSADSGAVAAEPAAILRAYASLLTNGWGPGDVVRHQVISGLRDCGRSGTASGLRQPGLLAKTGTVPSLDGRPLTTSGWAIAFDESGRGFLALLTPGTGRQAARALGARLRAAGGGSPALSLDRRPSDDSGRRRATTEPARGAPDAVTVSLFSALETRQVRARNTGSVPLAGSRQGFVGAGAEVELVAGDRLASGDWELRLPAHGLRRSLRGAVRVDAGPQGRLRVRAVLSPAEYVSGVIAAELPAGPHPLRLALGAAALRFLAEGPRHGDADVCDLTHCAYFVGRGPRVEWRHAGRRAIQVTEPTAPEESPSPGADEWPRMLALSRQPGPARWTSHCGGEPLSPHAVWGGGDLRVFACERHGPTDRRPWSRRWSQSEVLRAFGGPVDALEVTEERGQWRLAVTAGGARRLLSWDDAHARLAGVLGWGALPSPADHVGREGPGWRADGRGLGHRVGLCLGPPAASP